METVISVTVVIVYVILLTFVALRARTAHEFEEFSLAKRSLPLALIFGSLAATYVGPGFSIGFVGKGYYSGFLFLAIGLAYAIQNILVGLVVAPKLRSLKNCHTLGDAIGQKYDKKCQIVAGFISVGLCAGFSAVMAQAGGGVLHDVFNLPEWFSVALIVGITALYTTFGGLRASVITDAFQFAAFATLFPITLLLTFGFNLNWDASAFFQQASEATNAGLESTSTIKIISLVIAFLLGEMLIPPYANRALASKSTRVSRNGFILAGFFSIFWFMVMLSLGIMARSILKETPTEDHELFQLVKAVMPKSGYALLLIVLISVIMSSMDSLLNAGAVSFTQDIVKPFKNLTNKESLNTGRIATVAIAITAAISALAVDNIISGLLTCYAVWTPAILPSLILGLWLKKPRPLASILSMSIGATVSVFLWVFFIFFMEKSVDFALPNVIIPGLAFSVLAYLIGHFWKQSEDKLVKYK